MNNHHSSNHRGHHRGPGRHGEGDSANRGGDEPRGRRRRQFDGEALRLMALGLIAEEPRHGYELIRALSERSGGAYAPSPGMIYPLLTMLVELGLIEESVESGPRKSYALTTDGQAELAGAGVQVEAAFARLDALARDAARVDPSPVRRAVHNLRNVLIMRLSRDDASPETVFEAVALIDETARQIERL